MRDFAIFICTHGRPNAQYTLNSLRACGYTGKIYLVLDDEDETRPAYHEYLGVCDDFVFFNKQHYIDTVDIGRSDAKRKAILYAKCACEDFVNQQKYDAFVIADDDLTGFRYRYEEDGHLKSLPITSGLDAIIESHVDFMMDNNICAMSFGTSQMFMGGILSAERKGENRIPFNFVFRNASIPFSWRSEIYEDSISALREGQIGKYMLQVPLVQQNMKPLYAGADGGMTELYTNVSQFEKVFPVIKYLPSCSKIVAGKYCMIYSILKEHSVPKLISSSYRKAC